MKIKCPACSKILSVPETSAGQVVKCPCGKQLRVPATGGSPSPAQTAAGSSQPARPAKLDPAADLYESDGSRFDELTDQDLQGGKPVSHPYTAPPRSAPAADPLQGYAPPSGAGYAGAVGTLSDGIRATLGQRIIGALIDSALMFVAGIAFAIGGAIVGSLVNPQDSDFIFGIGYVGFYLGISAIAILNAVLISLSGQSIGKKVVKTRIVDLQSGLQVGFLQGVLVRNFVFGLITAIPCLGSIVALVDLIMLFPEPHQTLHDRLAKTAVIRV